MAEKKGNKKLVIALIVCLIVVAACIVGLILFSKNGNSHTYTKADIEGWIGDECSLSERNFEFDKYASTNYWVANKKDENNKYQKLDYYVFESSADAKKAFDYIKKNWINDVYDRGDNYIEGNEAGVCDAIITVLACVDGNMIVTCDTYVGGGFDDGTGTKSDDSKPKQRGQELKEFVLDKFGN